MGQEKKLSLSPINCITLYSFRKTDVDVILAETFNKDGVGQAVMNRMRKADKYIEDKLK